MLYEAKVAVCSEIRPKQTQLRASLHTVRLNRLSVFISMSPVSVYELAELFVYLNK